MTNKEIAAHLKEIARYSELSGENPFKVQAFNGAARAIESTSGSIEKIAGEGRLREIRGIGRGVEDVVLELLATGQSSLLRELKRPFPDTIAELFSLSGLGPKRIKILWEKLKLSTVGELEYACKENRLLKLDGFGKRSQDNILRAIDFKKRYRDLHLLSEARGTANEVLDAIHRSNRFKQAVIAGSLRRGKSILKDIDILLSTITHRKNNRGKELFLSLADNRELLAFGPTKVSIHRGGIQIDFRIVDHDSFPCALQHFTGSKEHNTILRARARRMGFKLNEYGLYRGQQTIPTPSEESIYKALGLGYIPPQIREGGEEIERGSLSSLPTLIELEDLRGMIHVHSNYSDGLNSIEEIAHACKIRGFSYLCLADHSQSAFYAHGLTGKRVLKQLDEVKEINGRLDPFRIFCGIESDILSDGSLDYPESILKQLDFVIGSIHSKLSMSPGEATTRLIKAIRNPYLTIMGHISGRLLLSREGYGYDEEKVLAALCEERVVLEHNCNPHRLDPDWPLLKRAAQKGIRVALSPDAHSAQGLSDIEYGAIMARKGWLERKDVINALSSDEFEYFLRERKKSKGL
jgi:DNA polymerase (family 10)